MAVVEWVEVEVEVEEEVRAEEEEDLKAIRVGKATARR